MSKATIADVQEYFKSKKYDICRTSENRVYSVLNEGKEVGLVRFYIRYDEVIDFCKQNGIPAFTNMYAYNGSAAPLQSGTTRVSRKTKSYTLDNERVENTRMRKSFDTLLDDAPPVEGTDNDALINASANKNVVALKDYVTKPIDWSIPVPSTHQGYYFPESIAAIVRRLQMGRNIFISGPAGTGKTEFVINLARAYEQKVVRVNFNVGVTEAHLVGKFIVKDGATKFIHGVVPMAMKNGWWIVFDEIDYAQPEHLAVLQPVLEGDALLLTQNENEAIIPHENFRVFATANTKGRGDTSQAYVGTNFMNLAFLDRWSIFEFGYTKYEKKILSDIIKSDKLLVEQVYDFFGLLRKAVEKCDIVNTAFSTRRMIQLAEMLAVGESLDEVLKNEIFNRYDKNEVDVLQEIAYDVWDKVHYFNGWKSGDAHTVQKSN